LKVAVFRLISPRQRGISNLLPINIIKMVSTILKFVFVMPTVFPWIVLTQRDISNLLPKCIAHMVNELKSHGKRAEPPQSMTNTQIRRQLRPEVKKE
jgi:hypothetical protein